MDKVILRKNGTNYELVRNDEVVQELAPIDNGKIPAYFALPKWVQECVNRKFVQLSKIEKLGEVNLTENQVTRTTGEGGKDWKSYLDETELSVVTTLEEQLRQYKELASTRKNNPELKAKAALQKKIAAERARLAKYEAELAGLNE